MKSASQLMTELAHRTHCLRELSEVESKALKVALLDIFKEVVSICEQYGLTYMMSGGSCLGAIRHKGFSPWDDDLDIMMPRNDYNSLLCLLEKGVLGDKYEFTYPQKGKDANTVFLKVFLKGSIDIELVNKNTPFPKGVFLDVFAIDSVPRSKLGQRIKGFLANLIQFISMSRLQVQYPSNEYKEFVSLDPCLKKRFHLKQVVGKIMAFASHSKWVHWYDLFVSCSKENRPWGIPTGRKYYNGEIFDKDVFLPIRKAYFEGITVNVPNNYHLYLTNLYSNYMVLPPVEKREKHFICEFQLPEEYFKDNS